MRRPQKQELFILSKSFIQSFNENSKEPDREQVICISSQWDIATGNCETKKQAGVEMITETIMKAQMCLYSLHLAVSAVSWGIQIGYVDPTFTWLEHTFQADVLKFGRVHTDRLTNTGWRQTLKFTCISHDQDTKIWFSFTKYHLFQQLAGTSSTVIWLHACRTVHACRNI